MKMVWPNPDRAESRQTTKTKSASYVENLAPCFPLCMVLLFAASISFARAFTDASIGFSVDLPNHWSDTLRASDHRYFKDTTHTYHALIGVVRYENDTTEEQWCNEMSYAYWVISTADTFATVFPRYKSNQNGLYAVYVEAYVPVYMPDDSTNPIRFRAEHVRYVAFGNRGYELYVTSDSADMVTHYADYLQWVQGIHILPHVGLVEPEPLSGNPSRWDRDWVWGQRAGFSMESNMELYDLQGCRSFDPPILQSMGIIRQKQITALPFRVYVVRYKPNNVKGWRTLRCISRR